MKRLIYVLLIIFFLGLGVSVQAKTCTVNFFTYFGYDYRDVSYCEASHKLDDYGCYPLTIASILKSYGEDVKPTQVADYLCKNHYAEANAVTYGNISVNQAFHDEFNMDMKKIDWSFDAIDATLADGAMVLASLQRGNNPLGSGFTDSRHYIAIAAKKDDKYFVINTSTRLTTSTRYSGWYEKSYIEEYVIKAVNRNWWSIKPKDCDSVNINYSDATFTETNAPSSSGNSGSSGGLMDDPKPDIFPDIEGNKCGNIFVYCTGEYTPLKEFLDDLFLLIKIATPILVIVLSTIDYIKAVTNSNADDLKKANKRTIMRLIIGLLIFLLPFLLELLFQLFGLYDLNTSGIGK